MTFDVPGALAAAGFVAALALHIVSYLDAPPASLKAAVLLLLPLPILVGWQIISARRLGISAPGSWRQFTPVPVQASGGALFGYLVLALALGEIRGAIHDPAWQLRAVTGALLWFYWAFTAYFAVVAPRARVRLAGLP